MNVTPRTISLEIGSVCDYVDLLKGQEITPENYFPCVRSPFGGSVRFTSLTAHGLQGALSWDVHQFGDMLGIEITNHRLGGAYCQIAFQLDETGAVMGVRYPDGIQPSERDHAGRCQMSTPVLMAISTLHARSMATVEPAPCPYPRAERRARARKKLPEYTYRVLKVPSITRTVQQARSYAAAGVRAHIVRGHYADYRDKGVFGNPNARGIYWKDAHVRGDRALGVVDKDYQIA